MTEEFAPIQLDPDTTVFRNDNPGSGSPILTVRVRVDSAKANGAAMAIQRITSPNIKDEIFKRCSAFGLADHGVSRAGGYRPVTVEKDGTKVPVAYELDFKFTRRI